MTDQELIKIAKAEQGGDAFPGIDKYKIKILPPGTRLVKLEPSSSGYFIPWLEYLRCRRDASQLSGLYQIAPRITKESKQAATEYDYRIKATLFITTREVRVAYGQVKMNPQYGLGGSEQIHIAGYIAGCHQKDYTLGIMKSNELRLTHNRLDSKSGEAFDLHRKIYTLTRNYHAYLSQVQDLQRLQAQITVPAHAKNCIDRLNELSKKIFFYKNEIINNRMRFKTLYPDLSPPRAPTYERAIRYQEQLARAEKLGLEMAPHPRLERESRQLRQHLLAKVDDTVRKVVGGAWKPEECDREIRIDELRRLYETDQFIKRSQCLRQIADQNARIRELELAIDRIDKREKELLAMGKLNHVLDDRRPALHHELDSAQALRGSLKNELTSLENRHHDYQTFLAISGKTRKISGLSLSG